MARISKSSLANVNVGTLLRLKNLTRVPADLLRSPSLCGAFIRNHVESRFDSESHNTCHSGFVFPSRSGKSPWSYIYFPFIYSLNVFLFLSLFNVLSWLVNAPAWLSGQDGGFKTLSSSRVRAPLVANFSHFPCDWKTKSENYKMSAFF